MMWHPGPCAEDVLCKKDSCPWGNWQPDTATGIAVDEKQLISWARTNPPKNEEDGHVSFKVEATSLKEAKWCTICCSRQKSRCVDRVASHISKRAWIMAQKPGSTVKISFPLLDFYSSISLSWSRSTTQLATNGAAPKSIGREVEKKCPVGASKHGRSGQSKQRPFFFWLNPEFIK